MRSPVAVAAVVNAIQGNWGAAALYAFGAVTGGLGSSAIKAVKAVGQVSSKCAQCELLPKLNMHPTSLGIQRLASTVGCSETKAFQAAGREY